VVAHQADAEIEREKTQKFLKDLEQKYQLTKDDPQEKLNYRFSGSSKNLKQNLESLFGQLNRMEFITSKAIYDQALGLFNIEIRKVGRGYSVFVTDENGTPVRHPVRMGDFEERPRFYLSDKPDRGMKIMNSVEYDNSEQKSLGNGVLKSMVIKELFRQMNCNANEYQKRNKQKLISRRKKGNRYRP